MNLGFCLMLGCASFASSVTNRAVKYETYYKEGADPILVGRLSDVEKSFGTMRDSPISWTDSEIAEYPGKMNAAGVKWYRAYFDWNQVEAGKAGTPKYGFTPNVSALFRKLRENGIAPYAELINGNPIYAGLQMSDTDQRDFIFPNIFDPAKPELDYFKPKAFGDFCGAFAQKYQDTVQYYEIGNESGRYGFSQWYGGNISNGAVWGKHYAEYFNACADSIRSKRPAAKIITGGMLNSAFEALKNYLPLIASRVNVLAIHPYPDPAYDYMTPTPEGVYAYAVKPFLDLAAKYQIPEVWITEFGWTTTKNATAPDPKTGESTSVLGQAKYLARGRFFYPIRCKIKAVCAFTWTINNEFEIQPTAKDMLHNLNGWIQGSDSTVSIAPYKGASAEIRMLNPPDAKYTSSVETYLLLKSTKKAFLVFWIKKTQDDVFGHRNANVQILFPRGVSVANLTSHDILDDSLSVPAYAVKGKELMIKNTWISDYPNLVEINFP